MKIENIVLAEMLPEVFISEEIPCSQIWKTEVNFSRGEHYLVEATSGGGKSSLCAYIFGSRTDYAGILRFNGEDVRNFSPDTWQEIRRTHLAYLPQELSLFPELSAIENIMLKNRLTDFATEAEIDTWLRELGVDSRKNHPVGKMSIGQQQRVGIIRSICQPFDFILLDEPVSHLDSGNNLIAARIITEAASGMGAGIITTSVGNHLMLDSMVKMSL